MLITALLCLLSVVALPSLQLSPASTTRMSALVLASTAALSHHACSHILTLGSGISIYGGLMEVTPTSYFVDVLLGLLGSLALTPWAPLSLLSRTYSQGGVFTLLPTNTYYGLLAVFSVTGSTLLVSSTSLLSLYLALELQSFGVYVLAALYRDSQSATAAGLTYFLLGGLSSCFVLLGSGQLYATLGVADLEQVYLLLSVGPSTMTAVVALSLTVLVAGLFFKVAAAPFHQWAPDVYDRVPTIITTWLQTMPKVAVIGLLLSMTVGLLTNTEALMVYSWSTWSGILMLVALTSIVVGSVLGLAQVRIKRLLTYSTISHVGFMLLALAAFSTDSVSSFLFYLSQYSLTSLASLLLLLALGYAVRGTGEGQPNRAHTTDMELLSELAGMITTNPMLSLGLACLLFSMAGVPPFLGFFAKQGVLEVSLAADYGGVALVAIIASVISACYYLKLVRLMHFETTAGSTTTTTTGTTLTAVHTFLVASLVLVITLYILLPPTLLDSTRSLALSLTLI